MNLNVNCEYAKESSTPKTGVGTALIEHSIVITSH